MPSFLGLSLSPFLPGCANLQRDGGILKSVDAGVSWQFKNKIGEKDSLASGDISNLFFDPDNSQTIYLTTRGQGIFKSTDAGEVWQNTIVASGNVYRVAFHPLDRNRIYIAGFLAGAGAVYQTSDAGRNWQAIYTDPLKNYAVFDVSVDNFNPQIIYIITGWGGILKSFDSGQSWTKIQDLGAPGRHIFMDPKDSRRLWVDTFDKGVWFSSDAGASWQEIVLADLKDKTVTINQFMIDLSEPNNFYVAANSGLFYSRDSGATWQEVPQLVSEEALPVLTLALNPADKSEIFYATTGAVFKSRNFGASWQVNRIASPRPVSLIAVDPVNPNVVYLGLRR